MIGKRISELTLANGFTNGDLFTIVQDGLNKGLTGASLIQSLDNIFATDSALDSIRTDLSGVTKLIGDNYDALVAAIKAGDEAVVSSLNTTLTDNFNALKALINALESTHSSDFQYLRTILQLWIDVVTGKISAEDLADILSKLQSLQDQIDALKGSVDEGGTPGDYELSIFSASTTQPQRPTFRQKPGVSGLLGPDNIRWYYDTPTGDKIWMSRGRFSGADDLAMLVDGNYWSYPIQISGSGVYMGWLDSNTFTVAADAANAVSSTEMDKVKAGYHLMYGNVELTYGTDYTLQILQTNASDSSRLINNETTNQVQLFSFDSSVITTQFRIQFIVGGSIVSSALLSVTKLSNGTDADYIVKIHTYAQTQPARPTFASIPTAAGSLGPDNSIWYVSIPSGDTIWASEGVFNGTSGLATLTDGYYWSIPYKITGEVGPTGDWVSFVFYPSPTQPAAPTGTDVIPVGWFDGPDDVEPIWWMSKALIDGTTGLAGSWSVPIQVTGEDGADGAYLDSKFARGTSRTIQPTSSTWNSIKFMRHPTGWSDTPPASASGYYTWQTFGEIDENDTLTGEWRSPVCITGESGPTGPTGGNGSDGVDGLTYSNWYLVSASTPAKPTVTSLPSGWHNSPQYIYSSGTAYWTNYVWYNSSGDTWMTQCKVRGTGTAIIDGWSDPIIVSGKIGQTSPTMSYMGAWNSTTPYYYNELIRHIVYYPAGAKPVNSGGTGKWYYRIGSTEFVLNVVPTNTTHWAAYDGNYASLATDMFFAIDATIAGWQFNEDYIASQNKNVWLDGRTYNSGTGAGAYPISIGPNAAGSPAGGVFRVDWNGNMTANSGTFNGNIKIPFKYLGASDASLVSNFKVTGGTYTYSSAYILNGNDLNIIIGTSTGGLLGYSGVPAIVLPSDTKYNGARIAIFSPNLPPYTYTGLSLYCDIVTQNGEWILGTWTTANNDTSTKYYSMCLIGQIAEFVGVNLDGTMRWVHVSGKWHMANSTK